MFSLQRTGIHRMGIIVRVLALLSCSWHFLFCFSVLIILRTDMFSLQRMVITRMGTGQILHHRTFFVFSFFSSVLIIFLN